MECVLVFWKLFCEKWYLYPNCNIQVRYTDQNSIIEFFELTLRIPLMLIKKLNHTHRGSISLCFYKYIMLLLTESAVHTRKYLLSRHAVGTERSEVRAAWRHNKYFPYGPNSRLIRALLYTHTSKTTKSQCFPLLLWIEVWPAHTPVRTQAYGPALSQSNFSILSVFCLVYNKMGYN